MGFTCCCYFRLIGVRVRAVYLPLLLLRLVYLPSGPRSFIISSHKTSPVRNHSYKPSNGDGDDDGDDDDDDDDDDVEEEEVEVVLR